MSFYRHYMTGRANEANFEKVRPFIEQIEAAADAGEYVTVLACENRREANTVGTYLASLGHTINFSGDILVPTLQVSWE